MDKFGDKCRAIMSLARDYGHPLEIPPWFPMFLEILTLAMNSASRGERGFRFPISNMELAKRVIDDLRALSCSAEIRWSGDEPYIAVTF